MLSDSEFYEFCIAHGLASPAYDYLRHVRETEPSRKVGEYASKSVSVAYPSQKMGRTIQAESRTVELSLVVTFEFDSEVLEYWDQPTPVTIYRSIKGGAKRNSSYTPDYVVVKRSGVQIVEGKTEEDLQRLSGAYPEDWVQDESGNWNFIPAQEAYAGIGLEHVVVSSSELNAIAIENKKLLLRVEPRRKANQDETRIQKTLGATAALSIDDLVVNARLSGITPVLNAIRHGVIYSDIEKQLLTNTDVAIVALNKETYELAKQFREDEASICLNGDVDVTKIPSAKDL